MKTVENNPKEQLLKVAEKFFLTKPYNAVSIREIAYKANVNSAMISYYFQGKKNLYDIIVKKQLSMLVDFAACSHVDEKPEETIMSFAAVMENIHQKRPVLNNIILQEFNTFLDCAADSFFYALDQKIFNILEDALKKGIKEGIFDQNLAIHDAVVMLIGSVNFAALTASFYSGKKIESKEKPVLDKQAENCYMNQSVKIFLCGISAKKQV